MTGTPQDKFNGYRCNISNGASSDGTLKKTFLGSMNEGWNEKGNGKEEQEEGDNENGGRNSCILSKDKFVWQGAKCELVDDVGLFVASGHVTTCDPREVVLDN
jgi:hypothetical protein